MLLVFLSLYDFYPTHFIVCKDEKNFNFFSFLFLLYNRQEVFFISIHISTNEMHILKIFRLHNKSLHIVKVNKVLTYFCICICFEPEVLHIKLSFYIIQLSIQIQWRNISHKYFKTKEKSTFSRFQCKNFSFFNVLIRPIFIQLLWMLILLYKNQEINKKTFTIWCTSEKRKKCKKKISKVF